ncbi:hypothetical protein PAJ_3609 [Pantoea ananatis AJ13355]|uniref:Uncharacterized protein n=1 Tax=Pantoea ananatis (strain AJ13355) TaxID=932677 RepID=A0A0H3L6X5_PANAA|nr:hypothetical protein PAJ_3609 [Pantoea ananatis AJ13355]
MIFITQDVGQDNKLVVFFHQAHCDTRNRGLDWHTGIHQCQRGTTDRGHRRGTVRFGDFRNHTHGIREIFSFRHHGQHAALRQTTVTDFTTLRRAHHTSLTNGVRREVIVEQEAVGAFAHQLIQVLRIAGGAQRRGHQRLCFTTGEQCGTVCTWQNARAHVQTTDHVFFTAINTWLAVQDAGTNHILFQAVNDIADFGRIE